MKLYATYVTAAIYTGLLLLATIAGLLLYLGWFADLPTETELNARKAVLLAIAIFLVCLPSKPKTINERVKSPYKN